MSTSPARSSAERIAATCQSGSTSGWGPAGGTAPSGLSSTPNRESSSDTGATVGSGWHGAASGLPIIARAVSEPPSRVRDCVFLDFATRRRGARNRQGRKSQSRENVILRHNRPLSPIGVTSQVKVAILSYTRNPEAGERVRADHVAIRDDDGVADPDRHPGLTGSIPVSPRLDHPRSRQQPCLMGDQLRAALLTICDPIVRRPVVAQATPSTR